MTEVNNDSALMNGRPKRGSVIKSGTPLNQKLLVTPQQVWKVDRSGNKPGEIRTPIDVAFLTKGHLVTSELDNQRLQVFNAKGQTAEVIGEGKIQPRCLAVDKEQPNSISVIDRLDRTIKILRRGSKAISSLGPQLLGDPYGLAITSTGKYVVTDLHPDFPKVSIYDPNGKCVRKFGTWDHGNHYLKSPNYVTVDQYDRIFVSDWARHCVKVFDVTGTFIQEFGERGQKSGQLMHPNGIFADCVSNLMIADNGNHRISMFSPAGKFIQQVLVEKDSISWPEGLVVSAGGHLAVTENGLGTEAVKVYEMK